MLYKAMVQLAVSTGPKCSTYPLEFGIGFNKSIKRALQLAIADANRKLDKRVTYIYALVWDVEQVFDAKTGIEVWDNLTGLPTKKHGDGKPRKVKV